MQTFDWGMANALWLPEQRYQQPWMLGWLRVLQMQERRLHVSECPPLWWAALRGSGELGLPCRARLGQVPVCLQLAGLWALLSSSLLEAEKSLWQSSSCSWWCHCCNYTARGWFKRAFSLHQWCGFVLLLVFCLFFFFFEALMGKNMLMPLTFFKYFMGLSYPLDV